jgi:cell division protein FtsI/penicillin-binding protein 2
MENFNRRVPFVLGLLGLVLAILVGQLLSFQLRLSPSIQDFQESAASREGYRARIQPQRGQIYDREQVVLAVNTFQYRVGISPALVRDRRQAAIDLAQVLGLQEEDIYRNLQPDLNGIFAQYVLLASPIDDATARQIEDLDISGLQIESIPLRAYPQGELTSQLIGFVNYSEQGFFGIEGHYDRLLAGTAREVEVAGTFLDVSDIPDARNGQSLVLTIDRDVQYLISQVLAETILAEQARGGTIIVMNPRTGEILGMQSYPYFQPGEVPVDETGQPVTYNPAIGALFEPGSIIKVVSAAITLQANLPNVDLNWTYNNTGCFEAVGVQICDFDRAAKGNVDFRRCLVQSLNTCTATWYSILGPSRVYPKMQEFGFGAPLGIDMEGEAAGLLPLPGDLNWSEAGFLNNSYGQGVAVTPLQILVAVNAIANDGLMMQPYIVRARQDGDRVFETIPKPLSRPISPEVADAVTGLMVDTMAVGTIDELARVEGYTIAGKTGTAQQPIPGGYSQTASWASFVGFLPADDPIVSILVLLDRPAGYWGSQTAAPAFQKVVERLVVLWEIPPDELRYQLLETGGRPFDRQY